MKLSSYFTSENPRKVTCLVVNAPEWLRQAIYAAHEEQLPNDWVYATCASVCDAIDDGSLPVDEGDIHGFADGQVDIYNHNLAAWFADQQGSKLFALAEEHADEMGMHREKNDMMTQLGVIQFCAIAHIADYIVSAVKAQKKAAE